MRTLFLAWAFCAFFTVGLAAEPQVSELGARSVPMLQRGLNLSPSTLAHVVRPSGLGFCVDLTAINNAFPLLVGRSPRYWADCDLQKLPAHYRAGFPESDDHAAFCQSLFLLEERYPDRFYGLDFMQWPFRPCLGLGVYAAAAKR